MHESLQMSARDIVARQLAGDDGHDKDASTYYAYLGQADEILADLKRAGFTVERKR